MVRMMVYNTQTYWVLERFPSPGILETREDDVLETGSGKGEETH
jgi:hypothetical protein